MYLFKEFATLHHALTKDQAIPPATLTFQPAPVSSIFLEATARRIAKHKDAQSAKRFPGRKQSGKKKHVQVDIKMQLVEAYAKLKKPILHCHIPVPC